MLSINGPDLVPTGVAHGSMGAQAPNPLMEQGQTVLNAGFNNNIAATRNTRAGNKQAMGYYSGNETELIIRQREPCFVERGVYSATGTSSRADALTGFNGIKLQGVSNEMDLARRFTYVGLSLGATYLNSKLDPSSQQGVATAMTGTWTMPKHYGKQLIHVGDPIRMRLPPLDENVRNRELAMRQSGTDFPPPSKLVATPEPVNPLDVVEHWRRSARDLIRSNFVNSQPNPAFDVRSNLYRSEAAHSNPLNAQDTMTVQLKQFVDYIGVTYAMHLIDSGLVVPVSMDADPQNAGTYIAVGTNEVLRSAFLREFNNLSITQPHARTLQRRGNQIITQNLTPVQQDALKEARDDFKRLLMGMQGLTREDGGPLEHDAFTRWFHIRALGANSGDARYAGMADELTSTSLQGNVASASLFTRYAGSSGSAVDQYRQIQGMALDGFMRTAGEVLDYLYMNCAGRSMSLTPEGSVLHGVR